jgi:hypothetical protein
MRRQTWHVVVGLFIAVVRRVVGEVMAMRGGVVGWFMARVERVCFLARGVGFFAWYGVDGGI